MRGSPGRRGCGRRGLVGPDGFDGLEIRQLGPARVAFVLGMFGLIPLGACKGSGHQSSQADPVAAAPRDAAVADADLDGCRAAAAGVPALPPAARAQALLDACRPCGEWAPVLDWNTLQAEGGPSRAAIERAMLACGAYCDAGAKQRFLGALDSARGAATRMPWRLLGEACGASVSAVPDTRFMSAPYFALDRIARALGDAGAAIAVPLPAASASGVGVELPAAPPGAVRQLPPEARTIAITVSRRELLLGELPGARLSAAGLVVTGDYPGAPIEPATLAAALAARSAGQPAVLIAPTLQPAAPIVDAVRFARGHALELAIAVPSAGGWTVPGAIPVALRTSSAATPGSLRDPRSPGPRTGSGGGAPGVALVLGDSVDAAVQATGAADPAALARGVEITIGAAATTSDLAQLLAALAARGVASAAVVAAATPARPQSPRRSPRPAKP